MIRKPIWSDQLWPQVIAAAAYQHSIVYLVIETWTGVVFDLRHVLVVCQSPDLCYRIRTVPPLTTNRQTAMIRPCMHIQYSHAVSAYSRRDDMGTGELWWWPVTSVWGWMTNANMMLGYAVRSERTTDSEDCYMYRVQDWCVRCTLAAVVTISLLLHVAFHWR